MDTNVQTMNTEIDNIVGSFSNDDIESLMNLTGQSTVSKSNQGLSRLNINYDIETGVHYKPNNRLNFFKTKNNFKNTNILEKNILTLPLHVNLTKKDIKKVTTTLLKLL